MPETVFGPFRQNASGSIAIPVFQKVGIHQIAPVVANFHLFYDWI